MKFKRNSTEISRVKKLAAWIRTVAAPLWVLAISTPINAQSSVDMESMRFFETKIRPVLVEKCYACHAENAKEIQGGLVLDTRSGIRRGGDSGPAVTPRDVSASLLITAIRYQDKDLAMPPKEVGGKLPDQVIGDFEEWVTKGAEDPRDGEAKVTAKYDTSAAQSWWSFQPIQSPSIPQLASHSNEEKWCETDIDRFIVTAWRDRGLNPVVDAEPSALMRRLYFDLIGLPPSVEEMKAFVAEWQRAKSGKRAVIQRTIDRLLESPAFGERWGRHWLDVARYAESSGKDVNVVFTQAWRYRDYVIDSLRRDKPFDQFLKEQIAGDLLAAKDDSQRAEQVVATGFLAIGAKSLNETKPNQFAVDLADEQIDAVSQAFLGTTVACARCHDHKFDPLSQRDYTALAGIFLSTETKYGTPGGVQGRNQSPLIALPTSLQLPIVAPGMSPTAWEQKQARLDSLRRAQRDAMSQRAGGRKPTDGLTNFDVVRIITQATQLESELSVVNRGGSPKTLAMGAVDRPASTSIAPTNRPPRMPMGRQTSSDFQSIVDSPFFARGNIEQAREKVPRGIPAILGGAEYLVPSSSSGRLELANALASSGNSLTSRVIVNRVWYWMVGRGLVASVDNFGTTGSRPSHPELLDYLAQRFIQEGWSIKKLVREIAVSHVYRLSTTYDSQNFAIDSDNEHLWRRMPRRLEAEEIRDAILSASGKLESEPPTASLIGRASEGPIGGDRMMALSEDQIAKHHHFARSIYLPIARNVQPDVLSVFDLPDASAPDGLRESTNVPSQALFMLNSDFVREQSRSLAALIVTAFPGGRSLDRLDERLELAFMRTISRFPSRSEREFAVKLLRGNSTQVLESWTGLVQGLFSTAEFRSVD